MRYKKSIRNKYSERNFNIFQRNDYILITDINKRIISDDWTSQRKKHVAHIQKKFSTFVLHNEEFRKIFSDAARKVKLRALNENF